MTTPTRTTAAALVLLLALSAPVAAQTPPAWTSIRSPAMGEGGAACTATSRDGDVFCFGLRCSAADNAPEWFTYQVGGDSVEGEAVVSLIVDGRTHDALPMIQRAAPRGEWSFSTPYEPLRHRTIVERLRAGSAFYVLVGGVSGAQLSLRGSAREIDRALSICRRDETSRDAVAFDPEASELSITFDELPQPVRDEIASIARMCGAAFRTEGREGRAIRATDVDGDGAYDFLLEHALFCPSEILVMCGASNCPHTLFVSANGAWRRFDFVLPGYEEFSPQGLLFTCGAQRRKAGVFMEGGVLVQRFC